MRKHLVSFAAVAFLLPSPLPAETKDDTAWEALEKEAAALTAGLPENEEESRKVMGERLRAQKSHLQEFLELFPRSSNRWEARLSVMQIANVLDSTEGRSPDFTSQAVELRAIADDKEAPENVRATAGLTLLQLATVEFEETRSEEKARALSAAIGKFVETHPDDARAPILRLTEAQTIETFEPEKARALYAEASKNEDKQIAQAGKEGLMQMDLRGKPMDLSFTALDGRKIDLADLRGKVVLVDFWATWCEPCMEEAPALVETYKKFKDRGFEIVGISLDEDKAALEKFVQDYGIAWPQFFDGKRWENETAKRFDIQSLPTMWLLDREGKLTDPNPRGRLEESVQAALDKP